MRKFFYYLMIFVTVICWLPFLAMLSFYTNWRQSNPATSGADIGLGMVALSFLFGLIPLLFWAAYGLGAFFVSKQTPMGPYFDGRRRRIGLFLLGVSCLFSAGWVRSYYGGDRLRLYGGEFVSHDGMIERTTVIFKGTGGMAAQYTTFEWSVPYLVIVPLLTLLAAWLLLSKPPDAKQPNATQSEI